MRDRWAIFRKQLVEHKLWHRYWLVMWVQNDDGSYRPLDDRTIVAIKRADTHAHGLQAIDDAIDEQEREQELQEKQQKAEAKEMAKEMPRESLAQRADEDGIGTCNIPKEDVNAALIAQYGEETLEEFA